MIYSFYRIPNNIPADFFTEIDKLILKFTWTFKGSRTVKTTLQKNKAGRHTLPNFKIYDKPIDQEKRTGSPEIYLTFFFFFLATSRLMRHCSSLTRDRTHAPCSGSRVLTTRPPGKSLYLTFVTDFPQEYQDKQLSQKMGKGFE